MNTIILAEPTLAELKAEIWNMYNDGASYSKMFYTLDDCIEQIGAKYKNDKQVWKDGELLTPADYLRRDIRMNEFTKKDFFELIDKHIYQP